MHTPEHDHDHDHPKAADEPMPGYYVPNWEIFRDGCPGGESSARVAARANRVLDRARAINGNVLLGDSPDSNPEIIFIATSSELSLVIEAHEQLTAEGIRSRVVSMPSWDVFEHQPQSYRDTVLPPGVKARIAVEQASTFGWERYVGEEGCVIGMTTFGASAPLKELQKKFGFEPGKLVVAAKEIIRNKGQKN